LWNDSWGYRFVWIQNNPSHLSILSEKSDGDSLSYIDTFDNEMVGYFGGIPVYHPLEVVPALPNEDPRNPENLVIGGGSGEHPGIVVKAPGEAVVCFVRTWFEESPSLSPEELQSLQPALGAWPDAYSRKSWSDCQRNDWMHIFEFAGWRAADYVEFTNRCASRAFHRPYDPGKDHSLEQWLAASVGEFILLAMPELAPDAIHRLGDLRTYVLGEMYRNILLLPPGYRPWGRREVDSQVIWGISAWKTQREQNPQTIRST
jgi:hypothetical protein